MEKLATPDVTIADLIGDIDPIKAARGGHELGSELTVHYGLLPRANRGIFAINELPDLAGKIQVGLFNIMQEGDVQIKGYPVRLPLDVALVFSANPEDYTARGKIITPLKDRIGSEIRTHYPATVEEGIAITAQEAWTQRDGHKLHVPKYVQEVVERIAFAAREDKKIDKRSGVSQRLPISVHGERDLERRAARHPQRREAGGAAHRRHLRRPARHHRQARTGIRRRAEGRRPRGPRTDSHRRRQDLRRVFQRRRTCSRSCSGSTWAARFSWPTRPAPRKRCTSLRGIQGLMEKTGKLERRPEGQLRKSQVSAAEFILEGLYAHKRIGRNEERVFTAGEKQPKPAEKPFEREEQPFRRTKTV